MFVCTTSVESHEYERDITEEQTNDVLCSFWLWQSQK